MYNFHPSSSLEVKISREIFVFINNCSSVFMIYDLMKDREKYYIGCQTFTIIITINDC